MKGPLEKGRRKIAGRRRSTCFVLVGKLTCQHRLQTLMPLLLLVAEQGSEAWCSF